MLEWFLVSHRALIRAGGDEELAIGPRGRSCGGVQRNSSGPIDSRWIAPAFAASATVINYLDRQSRSVLAPVPLQQFRLSATTYGNIIAVFIPAYAVMNGISGRSLTGSDSKWATLTDRLEVLRGASTDYVPGSLSLGIFRFILGAGEAGSYPAGVKLVREWFPANERSMASGIFNAGASVGLILAPPLLTRVALAVGRRSAFAMAGLLGFVRLASWSIVHPLEMPMTLSGHRSPFANS